MTTYHLSTALVREYARAWRMIREAVNHIPSAEWQIGEMNSLVPARLVFHAVQAADFHLCADKDTFDWQEFGFDWEEARPEDLPDQPFILDYITQVEDRIRHRLDTLGDDGLLAPDPWPKMFSCVLEHTAYALRHLLYHAGQLDAEMQHRRLPSASWR